MASQTRRGWSFAEREKSGFSRQRFLWREVLQAEERRWAKAWTYYWRTVDRSGLGAWRGLEESGRWGQPVKGLGSLHPKKAFTCRPRRAVARLQAD